jgi:hypothetical protein
VKSRIVETSLTRQSNPPDAHCIGKAAFDSPSLAVKAARRTRRDGGTRRTYHCASCGKWHLSGVGFRIKRSKNPRPKRAKNRQR